MLLSNACGPVDLKGGFERSCGLEDSQGFRAICQMSYELTILFVNVDRSLLVRTVREQELLQ
jgi:hypothetical protein